MAHEIKNPLTAVKTFTEYLPHKLHDTEFLQKFSNIVGSEVNRIDELVNQLLDFAKPDPLKLKDTHINKLIHDTLEFLNSEFLRHKITVIKKFNHDEELHLHIDPNQFRQALLNLFINSIEAMNDGGKLTIFTFLRATDPKSMIICIQDSGCGIPKADVEHIFDPFFSKKDNGTGLGLSIVHGIVQEHGGNIRVESKVGSGTRFIIEFPLNHKKSRNLARKDANE